jgi:TatD DNase family protein
MTAPFDLKPDLRKLARHPKVVAIGETGLDYYRLPSSEKPGATPADDTHYKQRQAAIFRQQMEVAGELGLNCVIHQRSALEDTITQMQPFAGRVRGVFHCFVETDSPYLAPVPYRGKRCEPAYVKEISELAASVRKCSLDDLSAATCATAHKFFPKLK